MPRSGQAVASLQGSGGKQACASCSTAPKPASAPAFASALSFTMHRDPVQFRLQSMLACLPELAPSRPGQYGLPSLLSLCCPACAYQETFRRACPRLSCCTGRISPPESGCPQQPPAFHPGFQTWPFWGRPLDRTCFCNPMLFVVPRSPIPPRHLFSINGSHQVAPYSLYTHMPAHAFSHVDNHLAASRLWPLCPQPD